MSRDRTRTAAARSVKLLCLLMERGSVTTAEAARALGVGRRLALEDLKLVASVAGRVRSTGRGRERRWSLDPDFATDRLGIADRWALQVGRDSTSFLDGTLLHGGLDRLDEEQSSIPPRLARNIDRKLRMLQEPQRSYAAHRDTLDTILDALLGERLLSCDYHGVRHHRRLQRFQPLTLVVYRRAVYLLGREHGDPEVLRLPVERIHDAQAGAPAPYPPDWDPDAELFGWFGIMANGERGQVVLRFTPKVAPYVHARRWGPHQELRELPDGGVELRMYAGGGELERWVLEWGQHCLVLEPAWLRRKVLRAMREGVDRYERTGLVDWRVE